MTADEVHKILDERQSRHEDKCDARQKEIYSKIDALSRVVYVGFGIMLVLELILLAFGPGVAEALLTGK